MKRRFSEREKKQIAKLWNSGLSFSEIGERFGVSRQTVSGIKSRNPDLFVERAERKKTTPAKWKHWTDGLTNDFYGLFSERQQAIAEFLATGATVSRSRLVSVVYGADEPEWPETSISVFIHRINKKIKPLGYRIFNGSPGRNKNAVYRLEKMVSE